MLFVFLLLAFLGCTPSVFSLICQRCESKIGWDDCYKNTVPEVCGLIGTKNTSHMHQCFQLEEMDPYTKLVRYRQGCTGDAAFCTERDSVNMKQCSLCTDDSSSSECTAMKHRMKMTPEGKLVEVVDVIHIQRSESDAKPVSSSETVSQKNSSTVSSDRDGTRINVTNLLNNALGTEKPSRKENKSNEACRNNTTGNTVKTNQENGTRIEDTSTTPINATGAPDVIESGSNALIEGLRFWMGSLLLIVSIVNYVLG
ncbi:uncharacterized protein LOC134212156 isoform X2 [Armigeres subalbatus]|uniref:uncharacterized protein LOC134212156 isoform X2 n=1 Tax=Armigeres subalbatus TaxID=124917 RepID=UPI002ED6AF90